MTLSTFWLGNDGKNWRSDPKKPMFSLVYRRFIRSLIYVLVAGQVLLSAPIASAMAGDTAAATSEMPCADSMPQTEDSEPCPCCLDGTVGAAA